MKDDLLDQEEGLLRNEVLREQETTRKQFWEYEGQTRSDRYD